MNVYPARYFIALATELHFRRAAEQLNLSQPALSRAIQQLERQIGCALFDRTRRPLSLTQAGERFLQGCRIATEAIERAIADARDVASGQSGQLSLGYTDLAIAGALPHVMQTFRQAFPGITLSARHGSTRSQLADLADGRLDVGFLTGPISQPDLDTRVVQLDRFVVLLAKSHRLARRRTLQLSDLKNEMFVIGEPREWTHFHAHLFNLCRSAGLELRVAQSASNNEGIFGLVACGMGISIQAESIRNYVREGVVVRPLTDRSEPVPTLATWKRANRSTVLPLMLRHLQARFPSIGSAGDPAGPLADPNPMLR